MASLDLNLLDDALQPRGAAAFRIRTRLLPAGGPGAKVFPPTYGIDGDAESPYVTEQRVFDGERKPCVILDSVGSQANRFEAALVEAFDREEIDFPHLAVDFSDDYEDIGRLTSLDVPHRLSDAILRDSEVDGTGFRDSELGQEALHSTPADAKATIETCLGSVAFGFWDSTGELAHGAKFPRTINSEIVGVDIEEGAESAVRADPLEIESHAKVHVPEDAPAEWLNEEPDEDDGEDYNVDNPSEINHGRIPAFDQPGGVSIQYATQTTVVSLPQIRRLQFPEGGDNLSDRNLAGRTLAAAFNLAAHRLAYDRGFDLRSRCLLIPDGTPEAELVENDGSTTELEYTLDDALETYDEAFGRAKDEGLELGDRGDDLVQSLEPSDKVVELVRRSRAGSSDDE